MARTSLASSRPRVVAVLACAAFAWLAPGAAAAILAGETVAASTPGRIDVLAEVESDDHAARVIPAHSSEGQDVLCEALALIHWAPSKDVTPGDVGASG